MADPDKRRSRRGERRSSGWAPYWLPMLTFLLIVEFGGRLPEGLQALVLVARVAAPAAFFVYFLRRGAYPELAGARWGPVWWLADVAVGLLGAAFWIAPFLVWPGLRPDEAGFDTAQLGADGLWLALALRAAGYALVTPFVEELFVRSWLLRYADVFDTGRDFRSVPIARFTWRSFAIVTAYFVFTHVPWEYGVMAVWTLGTMTWFYYRGHLAPLVLVHAVTNAAIFAFVVGFQGRLHDAAGAVIPLWFFL